MNVYHTMFCNNCIDRQIADTDILAVLSDPNKHDEARQRLIERLQTRIRLKEEQARMGFYQHINNVYPEAKE